MKTQQENNASFILEPIQRLTKDLKEASITLSRREVRYLVDAYYQIQDYRKMADLQMRSLTENNEPHSVIQWLFEQNQSLENQIKRALDAYSASDSLGEWARSIIGIGPVITAGLLAHIDLDKAPTVGHIWNFAGINPNIVWEKGQKRPFNAKLKTLCWKIGESFVKVCNDEEAFYGQLYSKRKKQEITKNLEGLFKEQAVKIFQTKKLAISTEAYLWYGGYITREIAKQIYPMIFETKYIKEMEGGKKENEIKFDMLKELSKQYTITKKFKEKEELVAEISIHTPIGEPMLPPSHIHARAKRYAVKLFLAHYHEMGYKLVLGKEPPNPYAIAILGHVHRIEVPKS